MTAASNDALLETGHSGHSGHEPSTSSPQPKENDVVDIQRPPVGKPWFEISKAADDKWYWCMWGGHGRAMAMSAVGYRLKEDAIEAIRVVGQAAAAEEMMAAVAYVPKRRGA